MRTKALYSRLRSLITYFVVVEMYYKGLLNNTMLAMACWLCKVSYATS
jgi:hypothetical protein